jgi:hypothetical protein
MNNNNIGNSKNNLFHNHNYLIWLLIYMGIGLSISFIVPFPLSFGVLLLVLFLLNVYRTDLALRRRGIGGIKGLYKSMSSSANPTNGRNETALEYTPLKFYCMNCSYEHRDNSCPKCGSKALKIG